ncbi:LysR family transcriptional regulator [Oleiphilus sp. HI0118]|jgi:DNA-binding transcriptional LysR family regulator|nr:LysR family transcriptional regulator [Oleiphilus sp. HI0118]
MNLNSPITIEALKVLDVIDRRGSYAAAAEELDKVPSALSYVVQKLEEQLDVTLFQKQGRRAVLTPAGRYLLEQGRELLNSVERLAEQTQNIARGYESKLRIAIDTIINRPAVYAVLKQFLDEHPLIEIDVREEALNGSWEALIQDQVDLLIGGVEPIPINKGIRTEPIGNLELAYVVAPTHPLAKKKGPFSPEQLEHERRVVTHDSARESVSWSRGLHNSNKHFYVPNSHSKRLAQLSGIGLGFLPRHLIEKDLQEGSLIELELTEKHSTPSTLYIAWKTVNRGKGLKQLRDLFSSELTL